MSFLSRRYLGGGAIIDHKSIIIQLQSLMNSIIAGFVDHNYNVIKVGKLCGSHLQSTTQFEFS